MRTIHGPFSESNMYSSNFLTYCKYQLKQISTFHFHRIARFLRQSFRQSVRRFRGETSQSQEQLQPSTVEEPHHSGSRVFPSARCKIAPVLEVFPPRISTLSTETAEGNFPPPDYATVIIETSRHSSPPPTFDLYER